MATSKTIAGLIGPTLFAIAVALLLNRNSLPALAEQIARDPALIFVSGVLLFVVGLAIVRVHNRWKRGWPVLVTLLGWLALVGGLTRMLFPVQLARLAADIGQDQIAIVASALVLGLVGAYLSFIAYRRPESISGSAGWTGSVERSSGCRSTSPLKW